MKQIKGELLDRILLNQKRMNDKIYSYPEVFKIINDWPGDFIGRVILSLSSLYRSLTGYRKEQNLVLIQLKGIIDNLDEYLNNDKYFGDIFNPKSVNEQQLAGNSWFIRGLIEYVKITDNNICRQYIYTISNRFLSKLDDSYVNYPIQTRLGGEVGGHISGKVGTWKTSTDSGCAFILLDGITAAYEFTSNQDLRPIIENIIEKFMSIDYVKAQFQTHASLSCARGIVRFYKLTKEKKYLDYAIRCFQTYLEYGMTKDYANFNWFGRKDTWTEPCCIVDSAILAKELYLLTGLKKYLIAYNRIIVNNLRTIQRKNGGAGCSTCADSSSKLVTPYIYEAYFCCTMRLGEGLKEINDFAFISDKNGISINSGNSFTYESNNLKVEGDIDFYYKKCFTLKATKHIQIKVYVPTGLRITLASAKYIRTTNLITINLDPEVEFKATYKLTTHLDHGIFLRGDMILTRKDKHYEKRYKINNQVYSYILDSHNYSEKDLKGNKQYL